NALVLRGEIHGTRLLLLPDLGRLGQNALLTLAATNANALHADIVIAGLPGDDEPLRDTLLNAIQPRAIIIADSRQPANKPANTKLKQRLAQRNIPIFYTSTSDVVTLIIRADYWELRAMDGSSFSSM